MDYNFTLNNLNKSITNFNTPKIDVGIYYRNVCEQINNHFIRTGIIIVILYLFFCWFNWWFFNYGYKYITYDSSKGFGRFIGNLDNLDTRIYWDNFIKTKLLKLAIGYIVVIIYFKWIY